MGTSKYRRVSAHEVDMSEEGIGDTGVVVPDTSSSDCGPSGGQSSVISHQPTTIMLFFILQCRFSTEVRDDPREVVYLTSPSTGKCNIVCSDAMSVSD